MTTCMSTNERSLFFSVSQNGKSLQFLLFVIDDNAQAHATIKSMCDVEFGIPSKCVKLSTIDKVLTNTRPGPDQVLTNILYGLNPKFNGLNVIGKDAEFAAGFLKKYAVLIIGKCVGINKAFHPEILNGSFGSTLQAISFNREPSIIARTNLATSFQEWT